MISQGFSDVSDRSTKKRKKLKKNKSFSGEDSTTSGPGSLSQYRNLGDLSFAHSQPATIYEESEITELLKPPKKKKSLVVEATQESVEECTERVLKKIKKKRCLQIDELSEQTGLYSEKEDGNSSEHVSPKKKFKRDQHNIVSNDTFEKLEKTKNERLKSPETKSNSFSSKKLADSTFATEINGTSNHSQSSPTKKKKQQRLECFVSGEVESSPLKAKKDKSAKEESEKQTKRLELEKTKSQWEPNGFGEKSVTSSKTSEGDLENKKPKKKKKKSKKKAALPLVEPIKVTIEEPQVKTSKKKRKKKKKKSLKTGVNDQVLTEELAPEGLITEDSPQKECEPVASNKKKKSAQRKLSKEGETKSKSLSIGNSAISILSSSKKGKINITKRDEIQSSPMEKNRSMERRSSLRKTEPIVHNIEDSEEEQSVAKKDDMEGMEDFDIYNLLQGNIEELADEDIPVFQSKLKFDKMSDEEILKKLAEFTFVNTNPVHEEHTVENRVKLNVSRQEREIFATMGMREPGTRFTAAEDEILLENWKQFKKENKLEDRDWQCFQISHHIWRDTLTSVCQYLGQGLQKRTLQSIYRRFIHLNEQGKRRHYSTYTPEENEFILHFLSTYPYKYKVYAVLGKLLHRDRQSLRRHCEKLTMKEEEKYGCLGGQLSNIPAKTLTEVVQTMMEYSKCDTVSELLEVSKIPWAAIELHLRCGHNRVYNLWTLILKSVLRLKKKVPIMQVALDTVKAILKQKIHDPIEVDWNIVEETVQPFTKGTLRALISRRVRARQQYFKDYLENLKSVKRELKLRLHSGKELQHKDYFHPFVIGEDGFVETGY